MQDFKSLLENAGLEPRESQLQMMQAVTHIVNTNRIGVIEGGTGVGKSYGYLIPVLDQLFSQQNRESGLRVVVATATVTLQEQLFFKDLKAVLNILNLEISAEIAKGRGRYVCPQRLYAHHAMSGQAELALYGVTESHRKNTPEDDALISELQEELSLGEWSGDRDELKQSVPNAVWSSLTADSATCMNRRCSYFSECPYFKARKGLSRAELIITNHDLLLSDIALGSGVLLPEFSNTVYIIDEAHHFAQKALGQFESETEVLGAKLWLRSLESALPKWAQAVQWGAGHEKVLLAQIEDLKNLLDQCHLELENSWDQQVGLDISLETKEFLLDKIPENLRNILIQIREVLVKIANQLAALQEKFLESKESISLLMPDFEKALALLMILIKKNHGFLRTVDMWLSPDQEPMAKWITLNRNIISRKKDFKLHAAWVTAADLLKHYFWSRVKRGVILCSATLRALGRFDNFLNKMGLLGDARVETHVFLSPFDYEQSELYIPWMENLPEGAGNPAHQQELIQKLPDLLNNNIGGVLVLFPSQNLLDNVFKGLPTELQEIILCQGQEGRSLILSRHRERIDNNKLSIIFGLQSFAEGVDLPGDYCTHVIITRLPFASPTSPTERAYQRWLEQQNKNAFMEHALPEASLKLIQAVGRLVRRVEDRGRVTLLDYRIIHKFYGKKMMDALPRFKRKVEIKQN